jgi:hypothetical protein
VSRKGNVCVAVASLDLLGIPLVRENRVRAKLSRIPAANILIGSTQTLSAPDFYALGAGVVEVLVAVQPNVASKPLNLRELNCLTTSRC